MHRANVVRIGFTCFFNDENSNPNLTLRHTIYILIALAPTCEKTYTQAYSNKSELLCTKPKINAKETSCIMITLTVI